MDTNRFDVPTTGRLNLLEEMFSVVYPEYNYRNRDSCTKVKRKKHLEVK